MNTRTQQDNDITLYSLDELKAMKNRYNANYTGYQPFSIAEVEAEIIKRQTTPKLVERAKVLLSGGYSEAYIQSFMYAERNESTGINHIVEAIKQAKA
jgi:hypothetical protein